MEAQEEIASGCSQSGEEAWLHNLDLWYCTSISCIGLEGPFWFDKSVITPISSTQGKSQTILSDRATLLQIFLVFGGFATIIFTIRSYFLAKSGQVADRYTKAASQLASDNAAERIGAIYALARLMRDSPTDHQASVDLLAAFVRQACPRSEQPEVDDLVADADYESGVRWSGKPPPIDVQTALNVLARRPKRYERPWILLGKTNLAGARFVNGWLNNLHFEGAILRGADFVGAKARDIVLRECDLRSANLSGAKLLTAHLWGSDLRGAYLRWVDLRGAGLADADLRGVVFVAANLHEADLEDADLRGVDMTSVVGLTHEQLSPAVIDANTKLPDYLTWEESASPS